VRGPRQSDRPDDRRLPERVKRALHVRRSVGEQVPEDVDAEIRFHLESRIAELESEGRGREEAERIAFEEFGDVAAARRALGRESARRERSRRGSEWVGSLGRDVAFGWRQLRTSPGFAVAAVLTLALGIGATTAIFSTVHAVLLRPLPYPSPERLVRVWETAPDGATRNVVSSGNYLDWRERATSFAAIGAHSWTFGMTLTGVDQPIRLQVARIAPSALRALGTVPLRGRPFTEEEGEDGAAPVALLSHRLWRERFAGDPGVIGSSITLDTQPHTIVGVMPPGFDYPAPEADLWRPLPFGADDAEERRSHQWTVVARLADGVTIEAARAEMDAIAAGITSEHPGYMTGWGVNVMPLRTDLVGEVRALLWVLMGVVGVVLLLTCVNLANLLLARATAREREIAVRGALGAGRRRLVRQHLVESLLLGVLGGGLGLAVLLAGLDAMVALAPPDIPLLDDVRIDPVVLGFAFGTTLLATLLFGLVPALRVTATAPGEALRGSRTAGGSGAGPAHGRLRAGLLVAEVALAVVLVVGAGLLLRSMARLNAVDPGLETSNRLLVFVDISSPRYPESADHVAFFGRLLDRVESMPGVLAAGGTTEPPLSGYAMTFSYTIEGRPAETPSGREEDERLLAVTPRYLETIGLPVLEGRGIEPTDRAGSPPVVVISESLARKQWPDGDAIGSRIRFNEDMDWLTVVGVVGDARLDGLDRDAPPAIYIAFDQKPWDWMAWLALTVRVDGDPAGVVPALRAELAELDPTVIPERVSTLEEAFAESAARRRFAAQLLGAFAALALTLGALGIYGLLAYSVAQRRQEIGIRMALGAEPRQVAGRVVRDALVIAAAGVVVGAAGAFAGTRALRSLLFQVEPTDPATFTLACALLLAVAALAAWWPARSATRVDPVAAMREG
jgi:putative ABC transport system permease protein